MKTVATALLLALLANGQGPQTTAPPRGNAVPNPNPNPIPVDPTPGQGQGQGQAQGQGQNPNPNVPGANPQNPSGGAPPQQPPMHPHSLPPIIPPDAGAFTCTGNLCMNRIINVVPGAAWALDCAGNCAGATINIDVGLDPLHPGEQVHFLDSIRCGQPYSCVGVTINIINTNMGAFGGGVQPVELNDLRCEAPYSCTGLIINAYNGVDIFTTNFDCQTPQSCMGCIVRDNMKLEACNQNQNPNGQLLMPWEVPGAGQQHAAPPMGQRPAHQVPMLPNYTPHTVAAGPGAGGSFIPLEFQPIPKMPVPQTAPQYGQQGQQYGQPQYGQPQYGQPQYGQPQAPQGFYYGGQAYPGYYP